MRYKAIGFAVTVLLIAAIILSCGDASASNHSATLVWAASPTAGATYNIYKANCLGTVTNSVCSQEGAFTLLANVATGVNSYVDGNVTAGSQYAYYLTAYCDSITLNCGSSVAGESTPSSHAGVVIPKDQPGAPTSLTVKGS